MKTKQTRKEKQIARKPKQKIYTKGAWENHQVKYFLRAWPFTGKVSGCPSKFCRWKELGPSFSIIKNGPNHKFWNLVCSPFPSWGLSHLRTRSPTSKFLSEAELESNQFLTMNWCWSNFHFAWALTSSNFNKALIRLSKGGQSSSHTLCDNCRDGRRTCGGRIASLL